MKKDEAKNTTETDTDTEETPRLTAREKYELARHVAAFAFVRTRDAYESFCAIKSRIIDQYGEDAWEEILDTLGPE